MKRPRPSLRIQHSHGKDALTQIRERVVPGQRLLGLDLGTKTIGLALSDSLLTIATPYETLRRGKFSSDVEKLETIAAKEGVGGLVVGLPLNMDGSYGPSAQSTRAFVRNFAARCGLPIVLWDERLSTAAVQRDMIAAETTRKRRGASVDKVAAAYILQGALDALRNLPSP
ncbi:MAG TPA: Holliday junction resolvase RuvX [Rhizomicrobium sp.]|nr:Holliday junction resolvase RuvX [Rhizomicrobium sp.]